MCKISRLMANSGDKDHVVASFSRHCSPDGELVNRQCRIVMINVQVAELWCRLGEDGTVWIVEYEVGSKKTLVAVVENCASMYKCIVAW